MSGEKNKLKTLAEIVAELRMGDDGGKPAYRIGRHDRVEISMPSREKIRSLVIEEVHISELADWIEAAAERETIGNVAAMREALTNLTRYGESDIRQLEQLAKRAIDNDIYGGGILQALCGAMREGKSALAAPPRNCDVGTPAEQAERFAKYCDRFDRCNGCPCCGKIKYNRCEYIWAQTPYAEEKGGEAGEP